jgi:murein DD-endopeptidase MepM/ murein hydrolase activator NlpD
MTSPRKARAHERLVAMLAIGFCLGALTTTYVTWRRDALRAVVSDRPPGAAADAGVPPPASSSAPAAGADVVRHEPSVGPADTPPAAPTIAAVAGADMDVLRQKDLRIPIDDVAPAALQPSFDQPRGSGRHEAIDILAPRHTPVRAVDDGVVAKLFTSARGGITVYQFDPTGRFCYYYAHLDRYAEGLQEQQRLRRGDLVGYVGTTGNAPPDTPHLHFAIFRLTDAGRWWEGAPIDPFPVLQ